MDDSKLHLCCIWVWDPWLASLIGNLITKDCYPLIDLGLYCTIGSLELFTLLTALWREISTIICIKRESTVYTKGRLEKKRHKVKNIWHRYHLDRFRVFKGRYSQAFHIELSPTFTYQTFQICRNPLRQESFHCWAYF